MNLDTIYEDDYYIVVGRHNDDGEEEEWELPVWGLMLGMLCLASVFAFAVFYYSYKREQRQRQSRLEYYNRSGMTMVSPGRICPSL